MLVKIISNIKLIKYIIQFIFFLNINIKTGISINYETAEYNIYG